MAAGNAARKKDAEVEEPKSGLVSAPSIAPGEETGAPSVTENAEAADREYVVLVDIAGETDDGPAWRELGVITAETRREAWEHAKERWPKELLPEVPTTPREVQTQQPVLAKVVPKRNFTTIESTVEYVAPRAVAKGV